MNRRSFIKSSAKLNLWMILRIVIGLAIIAASIIFSINHPDEGDAFKTVLSLFATFCATLLVISGATSLFGDSNG